MAEAVVFPGGKSGPAAPPLICAGEVAERRGARVHRHVWSGKPPMPLGPGIEAWVSGEVGAALDAVGGTPLLIGKSLGSVAAAVAAARSLPAVWLTPLLTEAWAVAALGRATAPFLLVGGTADPLWWDGALARRLSPHVWEAQGADHDMSAGSTDVLGRMAVPVEEFLDAIDWPG